MNNQNNNDAWTVFLWALAVIGCISLCIMWYEDNYCQDVVVPTPCSYQN